MGGHHSAQALHFRVHHRVSTPGMILDDAGCPRVGVVTWGLVANGGHKVSTLPCCRGLHTDVGLAFVPVTLVLIAIFLVLVIPLAIVLVLVVLAYVAIVLILVVLVFVVIVLVVLVLMVLVFVAIILMVLVSIAIVLVVATFIVLV